MGMGPWNEAKYFISDACIIILCHNYMYLYVQDEGVKQFETYHDLKGCTVAPTGSKKG